MSTSGNADGPAERLRKEAARRVARAASFLAGELKKTVSVPAPRAKSKKTGRVYARTKATKGAPPRKVTGRGRASIVWEAFLAGLAARVGTNVRYMGRHERTGHPWVKPTLARVKGRVAAILGGRA